jgi:hypothetical protein
MAVNLSALAGLTSGISTLSNALLVSPQNAGIKAQGKSSVQITPETFLFNYEGEQTLTLESDITDHYTEDNEAVQNQIALKPEMVTTNGYIGELTDIAPALLEPLKLLADKLVTISAYTPSISTTALLAYNQAFFLYQVAAQTAGAISSAISLGGDYPQNKQQVAFQKFYLWWSNRILFTVQTPWITLTNMAIKTLRAIQDPETRMFSDFEVTFKQMNFTQPDSGVTTQQGRLNAQSAQQQNVGVFSLTAATSALTFAAGLSAIRGGH